jgi:Skp family chaperone for outer membrane proteins
MKKIILLVVLLLTATNFWSQRNQIIAYIDMEYILENVPEYIEAQNTLDGKVSKWRKKLDKQARHIEVLKSDLANEKAILTKDLIEEKEEEITIKQVELRRLESLYFGPKGDLFLVRKQLVKPIQDQVFNAIQSIAKRKKYDFVFEKSSDLIMLYSNKKYDISDFVLSTIDRTRLSNKKKELKKKKANPAERELTEAQKKIIDTKTANIELKLKAKNSKKAEAAAKKIASQEAKKKAIAERRAVINKKREEQRRILREKQEAQKKKKEDEKNNKGND